MNFFFDKLWLCLNFCFFCLQIHAYECKTPTYYLDYLLDRTLELSIPYTSLSADSLSVRLFPIDEPAVLLRVSDPNQSAGIRLISSPLTYSLCLELHTPSGAVKHGLASVQFE